MDNLVYMTKQHTHRYKNRTCLALVALVIGKMAVLYSELGMWHIRNVHKMSFRVPGFLESKEMVGLQSLLPRIEDPSRVTSGFVREFEVPGRGDTKKYLQRLQSFREDVYTALREHSPRLKKAYETVTSNNRDFRNSETTENIALKLSGRRAISELTQAELYAFRLTTFADAMVSTGILYNQEHIRNVEFCKPDVISNIRKVQQWVRQYQENAISASGDFADPQSDHEMTDDNPLIGFLEKSRRIIAESRERWPIAPDGSLGPLQKTSQFMAPKKSPSNSFSRAEEMIVEYLRVWCSTDYLTKDDSFRTCGALLLRATGMYEGRKHSSFLANTFLQELGLIDKWRNDVMRDSQIAMPGQFLEDNLTKSKDRAWRFRESEIHDSLAGERSQVDSGVVFCVDEKSTKVIDDGFSMEPDAKDPSFKWLHVHVANPSAFISPDSSLAEFAQKMGRTAYMSVESSSMFPIKLIKNKLGLANDRACLTFSAKIGETGDIVDVQISHQIAKGARRFSYKEIDAFLYDEEPTKSTRYGDDLDPIFEVAATSTDLEQNPSPQPPDEADHQLSEAQIRHLRQIDELVDRVRERCARSGAQLALNERRDGAVPKISFKESGDEDRQSLDQHLESTAIALMLNTKQASKASNLVTQIMIVAGEVCAEWCRKRGVPIPYRGFTPNPEPYMSPEDFRKQYIFPAAGTLDTSNAKQLMVTYNALVGLLEITPEPRKHHILGLSAYCQATSPLRRYIDLVAHWQVDAALAFERRTGISLERSAQDVSKPACPLPFSASQVAQIGHDYHQRTLALRRAEVLDRQTWVLTALHRAFYYDQAPLPETYTARVHGILGEGEVAHGTLLSLGGIDRVMFEKMPSRIRQQFGSYRRGDICKVRIDKVDRLIARIFCSVDELLEREGKPVSKAPIYHDPDPETASPRTAAAASV